MAKLRVDKIAAPIVKDEFTGSVHFDGTGDYLSVADHSDLDFGTGDFTIEFWAYAKTSALHDGYVGKRNIGSFNNNSWRIAYNNTYDNINLLHADSGGDFTAAAAPAPGQSWSHYAFTRQSGTLRVFKDGVLTTSATGWTYDFSNIYDLLIGANITSDYHLDGYISNLRICKGHAVYTGNFTPPTRELEVHTKAPKGVVFPAADNRTVLLACQSSTDATADSSGRHIITANGNVTAADANPGLLRKTNITSTITENTGSVFFDGTDDRLDIAHSTDFRIADSNTFECWINYNSLPGNNLFLGVESSYWIGYNHTGVGGASNKFVFTIYNGSSWQAVSSSTTPVVGTWYHLAAVKDGTSLKMFVNGVLENTTTMSGTAAAVTDFFNIGKWNQAAAGQGVNGYLSNVRVCKGHAVYTSNFIPPTKELEVHEGPDDDRTVLLACYDGENIFAEKTGRHVLMAYGDRTSSPTPTATDSPIGSTTVTPGLTREVDPTAGPTFQGGVGFVSQNWLTLPKGTTTERYAGSNSANPAPRGLRASGQVAPNNAITNTVDSVEIATTGNALDFGDLITSKFGAGGIGSPTRGLFCGGGTPTRQSAIDYFTISTRGNGQDFGDITGSTRTLAGATGGNATRGLTFGGATAASTSNVICAITISTTGSATDFGDCTKQNGTAVVCSPTRAVSAGGDSAANGSHINTIDFVTIQSMGNTLDFGDLLSAGSGRGVSSITRGLFSNESTAGKRINYVTIATTGNAVDFGDLISNNASGGCASYSSLTRGCFAGIKTPSTTNTIEYFTIPTLGDALNFGNLSQSVNNGGGLSNGHGGLG